MDEACPCVACGIERLQAGQRGLDGVDDKIAVVALVAGRLLGDEARAAWPSRLAAMARIAEAIATSRASSAAAVTIPEPPQRGPRH